MLRIDDSSMIRPHEGKWDSLLRFRASYIVDSMIHNGQLSGCDHSFILSSYNILYLECVPAIGCKAANDSRSSWQGTNLSTEASDSPFSAHCNAFSNGVRRGTSFAVWCNKRISKILFYKIAGYPVHHKWKNTTSQMQTSNSTLIFICTCCTSASIFLRSSIFVDSSSLSSGYSSFTGMTVTLINGSICHDDVTEEKVTI